MVKIFSNFDTNLAHELLTKYQQQYGVDKVIFVRRWGIYLVFKAFIPLFRATVLLGGGLIGYAFALEYSAVLAVFVLIIVAALCIFWLWILWKALAAMINFYLDFTIVTPQQIISYDQHGIFTRNTRTVEIEKIKLLTVNKKWIVRSFFNYGSIEFFAEWDGVFSDLNLDYIYDPLSLRDKMAIVMGMLDENKSQSHTHNHPPKTGERKRRKRFTGSGDAGAADPQIPPPPSPQ